MPKKKEVCQDIKTARKEEIAKAALRVFSVRSFEGAQMTDIAKEAKISHGLIYHYFKDKQDIFDYAAQKNATRVNDNISKICAKDLNFEEKLTQIAEFFLNSYKENDNYPYQFFAFVSKRFSDISHNVSPASKGGKRPVRELIVSVFEQGEREKTLIQGLDCKKCASLFWALVTGTNLGNILKRAHSNKEDTQTDIFAIVKLFLNKKT